ncbi:MAG: hypothetical protein RBQ72_10320 [Desulfobacterium sp.]|jgi:hypothetical protein|nr:hypothetical protein [Desulfobacterium sp.]
MKKMIMVAVLFCFVAGFALPVQAIEVDFSGSLQFEGILNSSERMLEEDSTSDFRQMRLRVQTEFTITDDLKVVTRFDALEKVLSSKDSAFDAANRATGWDYNQDQDNIDFDRAYLSWKSPIGLFEVGRMEGVTWGTDFCDDEADTDRIKYVLPVSLGDGKLYIGLVAEKVTENDKGPYVSDLDNDKYYIGATYVAKNYKTGLLTAFYNFKKFQDPGQAFATKAFADVYKDQIEYSPMDLTGAVGSYARDLTGYGTALYMDGGVPGANVGAFIAGHPDFISQNAVLGMPAASGGSANDPMDVVATRGATTQAKVILLAPYFEGKFGNFSLSTELDYVFGTAEYDNPGAKDRDLKAFAYFVEGGYDMGPLTFQLGFAHSKGDADYTDDKIESMGYVSPGVDWKKLLILHDDVTGMNTTLANGLGNHVGAGFATPSTAMLDGYQLLYAGVDYALTDTISLGFIAGMSKADEVPSNSAGKNYDDDQGVEYDATFTWNLTKNLQYKAVAAYLDGGDYWNTRTTGIYDNDIDPDIYTLYHKLTLTF